MNDWKAVVIALLLCIVATGADSGNFERRWCLTYPEFCSPAASSEYQFMHVNCSDERLYCEDEK